MSPLRRILIILGVLAVPAVAYAADKMSGACCPDGPCCPGPCCDH